MRNRPYANIALGWDQAANGNLGELAQTLVGIQDIDITQGGPRLLVWTLHRGRVYGRLVESMVRLSSTFEVRLHGAFADLTPSHYMVLRSSTWSLLG